MIGSRSSGISPAGPGASCPWKPCPLRLRPSASIARDSRQVPDSTGAKIWQVRLILGALLVTPLFFCHRPCSSGARLISRRSQAGSDWRAPFRLRGSRSRLPWRTSTLDRYSPEPAFAWPYGLSLFAAVLVPFVVDRAQLGAGRAIAALHSASYGCSSSKPPPGACSGWAASSPSMIITLAALNESLRPLGSSGSGRRRGAPDDRGPGAHLPLYRLLPRSESDSSRARLPELWRRLVTAIGAPFVCVDADHPGHL